MDRLWKMRGTPPFPKDNVSTPTIATSDFDTQSSRDDEVSSVSEQAIDVDGIVNTGSNVESPISETSSPALRRYERRT